VHVSMAEPFCPDLSRVVLECARASGAEVHEGGTYLAMEGPAFSTAAESKLYKAWGADVIGMTIVPEAHLAREAEICYASICAITDYDAWMEKREAVTVDTILGHMKSNMALAKQIIKRAVSKVPQKRTCHCPTALQSAIVTAPAEMTLAQRRKFDLLIGKYIR
jgi:5'-methylthioadenosine phosphorylase